MPEIVTLTVNPAIDITTSVERLTDTYKMRCTPVRCDPGGSGINVARIIHRPGGDRLVIYLAGDPVAERLACLLSAEGLLFVALEIEGGTRENSSVTGLCSHREFRFIMPGPVVLEAEWQCCLDHLDVLQPSPRYLALSESLPLGVADDFYAWVIDRAKARGNRVVLDTAGLALRTALLHTPYLIRPSLNGLRRLTGHALEAEADCMQTAREIVRKGYAQVVMLTLGAGGAMLVTQGEVVRSGAVGASILNTIGTGDSFVGGVVWALNRDTGMREAFRHGMIAAAAALSHAGIEFDSAAEIEQRFAGISLSRVASASI